MIRGKYLLYSSQPSLYAKKDESRVKLTGVARKVIGQVEAINAAGIQCELLVFGGEQTLFEKILVRLPFSRDSYSWPSLKDIANMDYLYIRKPVITPGYIAFLKNVRRELPDALIFMEIPTFPYDSEMKTPSLWPLLLRDRWNRKRLQGLIDAIVDLSGHNDVFGIPTIQIVNGVSLDKVPPRSMHSFDAEHAPGRVNLICVAQFCRWHGIDRLIKGMDVYAKSGGARGVVLHLVGDGPALEEYKALARRCDLEDSVLFYGRKSPEEFAELYDNCDFAVASLGLHRIGINLASTLKTREYLAKGIPFVYSGDIDVFLDEPVDFCLQVPADESPIDVGEIVSFCDKLYEKRTPEQLTKEIRSYAERHVSMDAAMRPVIDCIKEECAR